ncbi:MAG: prepilin peptidase [Patescibacteria group bacterium]|nr:prepilin peptidase [Patescibacteria group bacterium]
MFFVVVFVFGLFVGSFLNCVVYRLEVKKSFLQGRSFCPKCRHTLAWYDLIPVLSFVFLRGKCRYCNKKISWQYPVAELATGLVFLIISNFQFPIFNQFPIFEFSNIANLIFLLVIVCFLEIIFIYDLKHYIIPSRIIYPAIVIVFLYQLFGNYPFILNFVFAGLAAGGFFFLLWLVSGGRWMGFADAPLGFLLGLWLGFPEILIALFLAFFIGSAVGLILIGLGKKKMKSPVAFGPFLVAGAFIAFLWGEKLWSIYFSFLGIA